MKVQLSYIERRLQDLMEVELVKYFPRPALQDRIAQRMAEALHVNLSAQTRGEAQHSSPHQFLLVVHPSTMSQWQTEPCLMEGLARVFGQIALEMGLNFVSPPAMTLTSDYNLPIDGLDLRPDKLGNVAETQNIHDGREMVAIRDAFLIVGGTKVFTVDQVVTNIGRRFDNQLVINDPRISRYHAQIRYGRGLFVIFDLNSTGGTFVNGQRSTQCVLYPGDVISLAGFPIVFGQDNPPPAESAGDTAPLYPPSSERKTPLLDSISANKEDLE